ncbi:MAG: hypothetical protein MJ197_08740 [Bacteroidales bacterium]|nr:hypothetical protein [Bacteroidales bacterium]
METKDVIIATSRFSPEEWRGMYGFEYGISSVVYILHKKNGKTIDVCRLDLKTWGSPERVFEERNRCALRDEEIEYITDKNGKVVEYQFSVKKRIEKYKKNMEYIKESLQRCEWDKDWIRKYHYGNDEAIQRNLAENEENIKYYNEIKAQNERILNNLKELK